MDHNKNTMPSLVVENKQGDSAVAPKVCLFLVFHFRLEKCNLHKFRPIFSKNRRMEVTFQA